MKRTQSRRRRSKRPMHAARNYWFWYTSSIWHYEAMMSRLGRCYASGAFPL